MTCPTTRRWPPVRRPISRCRAWSDRPAPQRGADQAVSRAANRRWWDADADAYHAEHGEFLGEADLVWCPEPARIRSAAAR